MSSSSSRAMSSICLFIASHAIRDVKASRPNWPRGQNFGLGLVTSGLGLGLGLGTLWPRPRTLIFDFKEPVVLSFRNTFEPPSKKTHSTVWSLSCSITESECLWRTIKTTAESSALSKLYSDFASLQPLFERLFCVPASSAPVERVFSQSGLTVSFLHTEHTCQMLRSNAWFFLNVMQTIRPNEELIWTSE